jgi:hypothetical protein
MGEGGMTLLHTPMAAEATRQEAEHPGKGHRPARGGEGRGSEGEEVCLCVLCCEYVPCVGLME